MHAPHLSLSLARQVKKAHKWLNGEIDLVTYNSRQWSWAKNDLLIAHAKKKKSKPTFTSKQQQYIDHGQTVRCRLIAENY